MSDTAIKLNEKLIEVGVADLEVGMYVSALDRPWLDTPFLFQGFTIVDQGDIDELRKHCQNVYVDAEQTHTTVDLTRVILKRRKATGPGVEITFDRTDNAPATKPVRRKPAPVRAKPAYTSVAEIRGALAQTKEEHEQASKLVQDVMDNLNDGGKLDVGMAKNAVRPIVESVMRNESAMSWLVRMRQTNDYLYRHSVSSAVWAAGVARHIGMPKDAVETIGLGAMLLDVGKTQLPRGLLVKPERLTDEEMVIARQHVELGLKILDETKGMNDQVKVMVKTHHERHDGSGYPSGLAGNDIPVLGRIAGIVDYYDAVTSDRPYAEALSSYDCLRAMNKMAGITFQREMVEQFIQSVGFFPPGTLVQMNDRSVAVVVAQNRRFRLKPEIMVVLDPEQKPCVEFQLVDLQMEVESHYTKEVLFIDKGLEPGSFGIDPAEYFLQ